MFKSRPPLSGLATALFLALVLLVSSCTVTSVSSQAIPAAVKVDVVPAVVRVNVAPVVEAAASVSQPTVQVTLSAANATESWDSRLPEPEPFDLPLLYLHHERVATAEGMRTLALSISGLPGGSPVEVEMVSWHDNPATRGPHRETARFQLPDHPCTEQDPCAIEWALDAATTLSDLYRLTLRDDQGNLLWQNPYPERPDFVALDTWEVGLGDYTVRIAYATLFPFARGEKALYHRLAPEAVHEFIAGQLVPIIVETWTTQFDAWGFGPIHPDWDADKVVEVFLTCPPFALWGGTGTYTASTYSDGSPYPERRIWLISCHNTLQGYDSLENGYKVILSHEFFHMVQWNILLWTGCPARKWTNVFLEAQAKVASAVQYPELELTQDHLTASTSEYSSAAQRFLSLRLRASYADLEAETSDLYDAALYWRFLYEQFGGMGVLRAALEEIACRPVEDIPASLDEVMDAALARLGGPLGTFEESLAAFARANFALRLEDGRCAATEPGACEGKYDDPHGLYPAPALQAELVYDGSPLVYDGALPASFSTDLIQVRLDSSASDRPLTLSFCSEGARFSVQLWQLDGQGTRAMTAFPETLAGDCSSECRYTLPSMVAGNADSALSDDSGMSPISLALIIVRLDPHERIDPAGRYDLTVE